MILKPGFRAPDVRIATVGGVSRAIRDYRGKATLVYGWGSWHESRAALGALQQFGEANPELQIVSLAFDAQGPGFPMKFLKPAGATYEFLIDATCTVCRVWGVKDLPLIVLLDADGFVQHIGDNLDTAALSAALKKDAVQKGDLKIQRTKGHAKLDILVNGVGVFLSRGRTRDAVGCLQEALKLDPENRIISGQIEALENPAKVYGK